MKSYVLAWLERKFGLKACSHLTLYLICLYSMHKCRVVEKHDSNQHYGFLEEEFRP